MNTNVNIEKKDFSMVNDILKFSTTDKIPLKFVYGEKTVCGIPASFSPNVTYRILSSEMVQYIIDGTDENGLNIRGEYIEYKDYPVTEWVFYFTNKGEKDTPILKDIRIEGTLICPDAVLEYGNGDTRKSNGYLFFNEFVNKKITLTPTTGTSCEGAFPYMTLHGVDREIRAAIGWPTKWVAQISPCEDGVVFSCGQDRCATVLHSGETYRTPRLNLMVYTNENAPYRGINLWRHWYFEHIIPRENGRVLSPKLCLLRFAEGGRPEFVGATENGQAHALQEFVRRGMKPDIWWVDAGWYPCEDWHETGNWYPDPERFPDGMETLGKTCKKNDVDLLLWFEPERVRTGIKHEINPEWLLSAKDENGEPLKNQLLDLGRKDVLEWLIPKVDSIIKKANVAIYRQDFNMNPLPMWEQNEPSDRIGMMENLHAQGYLAYWDALMTLNPGLLMDSCASGGRRNDLETMRRSVPFHYTDVGYGNHPVKQKQYREMFEWIPYFRSHSISWDNPETCSYDEKKGRELDEFAFYTALAPSLSSTVTYDDTEEHFALGMKMQDIWRDAAELELSGDYYPISECRCDPHDWYAMQFDNATEKKGFIHIIRNVLAEDDTYTFGVPSVRDGMTYTLTDRDRGVVLTLSAEELKNGLTVELPKRSGAVYFYTYD